MAIQEVEQREVKGTKGIQRTINSAAIGMVMDIVQAQQYTKPVPSTVRELTANAVDAQREKVKAIMILSGKAKVEDFFIKRDDPLYRDSNWDPSYYDINYLDQDKNDVHLIYKKGEGVGRCDRFIVRDWGVGLGMTRLAGVLQVGYSTKRNRKDQLGAFGLGAKVGLSTGAEYYKVVTAHNGIRYEIQVFSKKLNSLIPPINLDTGKPNIKYEFFDEHGNVCGVIYGAPTEEKNFTQIEVPSLKHHRHEYEVAVKTQLNHVPGIKFLIEELDGDQYEVQFKSNVLYNSENIIISENTPYSKPYVAITNGKGEDEICISYGHIDFQEMEMESMSGDIGIKCPIRQTWEDPDTGEEILISEGVDVIASREAVRWTAATREFLKKQFAQAQVEATGLIEKELKQSDFIKWLEACKNITQYSGRRNTAIGRLSNIVDINSLRPRFNGTNIKFDNVSGVLDGFKVRQNTKFLDKKENKYKVNREDSLGWHSVQTNAMYLQFDNTSRKKDVFLCDQHGGTFTTLQPKTDDEITREVQELVSQNKIKFAAKLTKIEEKIEKRDLILELLKKAEEYKTYDDVEVPEDYLKQLDKLEKGLEEEEEAEKAITPAERRKLEQRVVANTYEERYIAYHTYNGQTFQRAKIEPKFEEVKNYKGKLYYGNVVDEEKMHLALHIANKQLSKIADQVGGRAFKNPEYWFALVSKDNKKYFDNHSHINDFFGKPEPIRDESGKVKGINIMVDNAVVRWYTGRMLKPFMNDLAFFKNFSIFAPEMSKLYKEVSEYVDKYHSELSVYSGRFGMEKHYNEFLAFLEKLREFQEYIEVEGRTTEEIADKAKELALPNGTHGTLVVDSEMMEKCNKLREFAGPVKDLFNHIPLLTGHHSYNEEDIPLETQMMIKEILELKGLKDETIAKGSPELVAENQESF